MKIIRYADPSGRLHFGCEADDGSTRRLDGDPFAGPRVSAERAEVARLLAPVVPAQILCIGLNYRRHAIETKARLPERPVLFLKSVAALQDPGAPILIPTHACSFEVDFECELAVVIGRTGKNIRRADAYDHILGYTCANDVSARDHQLWNSGGQWCRAKSFDTFAPLGPRLVTTDEIPNPNTLRISTLVNGRRVQDSNTGDMIFDVPALIEFLSRSCTLPAGTVILTGTPEGVGMARQPRPLWLQPGDAVSVEIERIGTLTNPVALEPA